MSSHYIHSRQGIQLLYKRTSRYSTMMIPPMLEAAERLPSGLTLSMNTFSGCKHYTPYLRRTCSSKARLHLTRQVLKHVRGRSGLTALLVGVGVVELV